MKKYLRYIFLLVLIVLIGACGFIEQKDTQYERINNSLGLLYFSTSIDKSNGKGSLYTINSSGSVSEVLETGGLELGEIYHHDDMVIVNDVSHSYLIDEEISEEEREHKEYTAIFAGYMNDKRVELYNSGYDENGTYHSHLYWQHDGTMQYQDLPYFITTAGIYEDLLYVLEEKETDENMVLHEIELDEGAQDTLFLSLDYKTDELVPLTDMIVTEELIYCIVDIQQEYSVLVIHKDTGEVRENNFLSFDSNENMSAFLPHSVYNSIHWSDNQLFFLDGQGILYQFNKDGELKTTYDVLDTSDESMYIFPSWSGNDLYVFEMSDTSSIKKIDLLEMDLEDELELEDDAFSDISEQFLYDFEVLNGF
ncbi:hypothetical protein GI584_08535 [Gracilibacillus salitolerans]|uniref:Lipoprotein n=1 Tax=Gracilibacillus salitolerans TaxID=2663022 RepID=A0A5Q2TJ46_9BACI|nr:hypothetical protein [Gracilibacillus salitolerans]QGH34062.1 hypothetical protein GI584_08535 [Gracilibacillus salitolerans]